MNRIGSFLRIPLLLVLFATPVAAQTSSKAEPAAPPPPAIRSSFVNESLPPLHRTIVTGDLNRLKKLLDDGADANETGFDGSSPLHLVVWLHRVDMLKELIRRGADIEGKDARGNTPLHEAARWGRIDMAKCLLEHKASVAAVNNKGQTPLHLVGRMPIEISAVARLRKVARLLIENGADLDATDHSGVSAYDAVTPTAEGKIVDLFNETHRRARNVDADTGHRNP